MKNIHVLPTNKPSSLCINAQNVNHIYITSDEKPKTGDWSVYQNDKIHKCMQDIVGDTFKKIILTTDQDLIKDGIQSVDDEFLEWFIKNPSCEEVKIKRDFADEGIKGITYYGKYFLIIPTEEPKQEPCDNCGNEICCCILKKQETLEGLVGKMKITDDKVDLFAYSLGLKEGAKWQSERMYSEEEVIKIVEKSRETGLTAEFLLLTEQFKKK